MDTRGAGFATLPYRTTIRRDSRIPTYQASKTTNETLVRGFESCLRSPPRSMAVSPGGECGARYSPSSHVSAPSKEGAVDPHTKAEQNRGEASFPCFCTVFCGVGHVHRRPDRRWTPGGAGSPSSFRTAIRADSPIPIYSMSKTTEDTLLHCFGLPFGWQQASIAVVLRDGRGCASPGISAPAAMGGANG